MSKAKESESAMNSSGSATGLEAKLPKLVIPNSTAGSKIGHVSGGNSVK